MMIDVRVSYARLAGALVSVTLLVASALANLHDVTIMWWLFDREASLILVIVRSA